MAITPSFKLSQTQSHIAVEIYTPYTRIVGNPDLEILIFGKEFHFYCAPYLLHLTFPHDLIDNITKTEGEDNEGNAINKTAINEKENETKNNSSASSYDMESMTLTINVEKEEKGKYFEDLDLLSKFMQPKKLNPWMKKIMEISSTDATTTDDSTGAKANDKGASEEIEREEEDYDAGCNKKTLIEDDNNNLLSSLQNVTKPKYGFNNKFCNIFTENPEALPTLEMLTSTSYTPDSVEMTSVERRKLRHKIEKEKFDFMRYMNDNPLFWEEGDDMIYATALDMAPHWENKKGDVRAMRGDIVDSISHDMAQCNLQPSRSTLLHNNINSQDDFFTKKELELLTRIRSNTPSFSNDATIENIQYLLMNLFDILFAYVYDHRTTDGEPTCESSWTVSILSPTLSWFEDYSSHNTATNNILLLNKQNDEKNVMEKVITDCLQRALIYPYLRTFQLSHNMLWDVYKILSKGRRTILRCLLQIYSIFDYTTDYYYTYNVCYIQPFIIWIQFLSDYDISNFCDNVLYPVLNEINTDCKNNGTNEMDYDHLKRKMHLDLIRLEHEFLMDGDNEEEDDNARSSDCASSDSNDYSDNSSNDSSSSDNEIDDEECDKNDRNQDSNAKTKILIEEIS